MEPQGAFRKRGRFPTHPRKRMTCWDAGSKLERLVGGVQRGQRSKQQDGEGCESVHARLPLLCGGWSILRFQEWTSAAQSTSLSLCLRWNALNAEVEILPPNGLVTMHGHDVLAGL